MRALCCCCAVLVVVAVAVPQESSTEPLVTRDQIKLNLKGAETIIKAARAKATELKLAMNIAVVDDGGHLISFARMDAARPASAQTALTKAISAATFRQASGPLPANGEPNLILSLGVPAAAAASGGKITTLKGGLPITIDGQVIGAVGVGGGTGEQDAEVGQAGIDALLKALGSDAKSK